MAQGRSSATMAATVMLVGLLLIHPEMAHATTYVVGDSGGWTFNVDGWPKGKRFKAGDTLVFKYNPAFHNVVEVNKAGYDSCTIPKGAKVHTSGKDRIKLRKGQNFFICGFAGHCPKGMKIAVNAL